MALASAHQPVVGNEEQGGRLLLTVKEAGRRLSIGKSQMFKFLAGGDIPSVTLGRSRRIPAEALERFVRERQALVAAEPAGLPEPRQS